MTKEEILWLDSEIARLEETSRRMHGSAPSDDLLKLLRCVRSLERDLATEEKWRSRFTDTLARAVHRLKPAGIFKVPDWREAVSILESFVKGGS